MKNREQITKALQILLMEYEYVIVPDFGGFITQYQPAKLVEDSGFISPPQRIISFNAQLKTDDGLLVNFLSRFYKIDIKEAKEKIKKFTQECFILLDKGIKLKLDKIGVLVFDRELNIQFSSFNSENYNPYSYGLKDVPYQRLNEKDQLLVKEKKIRASKYYPYAAILLPFILILWISSFYLNRGGDSLQEQETASIVSVSNNTEKEIIQQEEALVSKEIDKKTKVQNALCYKELESKETEKSITKPIKEQKIIVEKKAVVKKEIPKIKKEPKTPVKSIKEELKLSTYRLVAGSFKNKDNAYRLSKKIKALDYPATVIKKGNRYRVIAISFDNKKDAKKAKIQLKKKKVSTWLNHQK
jgi:hypothetical protein